MCVDLERRVIICWLWQGVWIRDFGCRECFVLEGGGAGALNLMMLVPIVKAGSLQVLYLGLPPSMGIFMVEQCEDISVSKVGFGVLAEVRCWSWI